MWFALLRFLIGWGEQCMPKRDARRSVWVLMLYGRYLGQLSLLETKCLRHSIVLEIDSTETEG